NAFVAILTFLAVAFSVFGFIFSEGLLGLLGTPEELLPMAKAYLRINLIGMLFLFGYNFISTVLREIVDSRSPLIFVIIAVLLNVGLDPLFIARFNFGVAGAAYATIIAQGLAFLYGMSFVLKNKLAPSRMPTLPLCTEVKLILKL